jgi:hypothetical protein
MKVFRTVGNILFSHLPLLTVLLIIFNTIVIDFFYRQNFSLDIFPYLSTSEILSFSIFSLSHFSVQSFLIWSAYSAIPAVVLLNNSDIGGELNFNEDVVSAPLFLFAYPLLISISNIIVAIYTEFYPAGLYISQLWEFQVVPYATVYSAALAILLTILLVIPYLFRKKANRKKVTWQISSYMLAVIFVQFVSQIVNGAKKECIEIKDYQKYQGTIIQLDSTKLISNNLSTYIGRTNSAVFVYDFCTKSTTALSAENIRSVTVVSKPGVERFIGFKVYQ